jgi:hypothetical protein
VEFFTLSWAVERWNLSLVSLLISLFLKSLCKCMSLRNLPKCLQLRSITKSRFSNINTNSDITPPNNLDMVTFEILLV